MVVAWNWPAKWIMRAWRQHRELEDWCRCLWWEVGRVDEVGGGRICCDVVYSCGVGFRLNPHQTVSGSTERLYNSRRVPEARTRWIGAYFSIYSFFPNPWYDLLIRYWFVSKPMLPTNLYASYLFWDYHSSAHLALCSYSLHSFNFFDFSWFALATVPFAVQVASGRSMFSRIGGVRVRYISQPHAIRCVSLVSPGLLSCVTDKSFIFWF